MVAAGAAVMVPCIADYELRRELVRSNLRDSVKALDNLIDVLGYLSITKATTDKACDLWAQARNTGKPAAGDTDLDGDMILCAHALEGCGGDCIIATTNPKHIKVFATSKARQEITMADL